jgi:hypothetical protein
LVHHCRIVSWLTITPRQHHFDLAEAQREAGVQPYAVADDLRWEADPLSDGVSKEKDFRSLMKYGLVLSPGVAFDTFAGRIDLQDPAAAPSPAAVHPVGVGHDVLTGC